MLFRQKITPSVLAISTAIAVSVAAAQTAHVHGEGRVNIAIDGDRVFMSLESPGADIVGFEYAPRSDDDRAAVDAALARLRDPMQLIRLDPGTECSVEQASSEFETGEGDHGEQAHEHDDHGKHEDEDTHGTFHAEYEFRCADVDALERIEFTYFGHFENAQSLDIVLIDGRGQRSAEVSRANPVLSLDP